MHYRKKPVVIEAVKIGYAEMCCDGPECSPFDEQPVWLMDAFVAGTLTWSTRGARDYAVIDIEGVMEGGPGDYLIRGVQGELYACKGDIFEATYESVTDDE